MQDYRNCVQIFANQTLMNPAGEYLGGLREVPAMSSHFSPALMTFGMISADCYN